jgi:biotin operon repressor
MKGKYNPGEDILIYLRNRHTGAENAVPSARIEYLFGIGGAAVRQAVNRLRRNGHPVCSNADGYFYAKNANEINDTIGQLLGRTKKITDAAQGLILSHQIFYDGRDGS